MNSASKHKINNKPQINYRWFILDIFRVILRRGCLTSSSSLYFKSLELAIFFYSDIFRFGWLLNRRFVLFFVGFFILSKNESKCRKRRMIYVSKYSAYEFFYFIRHLVLDSWRWSGSDNDSSRATDERTKGNGKEGAKEWSVSALENNLGKKTHLSLF